MSRTKERKRNEDNQNDGTRFLSARRIAKVYLKLMESDLNEEVFFAPGRGFVPWLEIARVAKEMPPGSESRITPPTPEGPCPV